MFAPVVTVNAAIQRLIVCAGLCAAMSCQSEAPDPAPRDAGSDAVTIAVPDAGRPDRGVSDLGEATADVVVRETGPIDDLGASDLGELRPVSLQSAITAVQPMTGIVLWEDSWNADPAKADATQLEYAYVAPDTIVIAQGSYDWAAFDAFLDRIAARNHQALVRFYYTYPGRQTVVPQYIKARPDYAETQGQSEGLSTWFPDWSNAELQSAHLAFYAAFAARYDADPRIAFLQVGFGLWGEYHIYDGPNVIGEQFPTKAFQREFFNHLDDVFADLKWSISIDAGDDYYSPLAAEPALLALPFGLFDDSFMHEAHADYNESMWTLFGHSQRYTTAPHGGELSYYSQFDQENVLNPAGIHGRSYETLSAKFHISYMIGNDQPDYQTPARIREAGLANGYKFTVTSFDASPTQSIVTVQNTGIAPIYYDAFPTVNGQRGGDSLQGLLPGNSLTTLIPSGGPTPTLTIECDRLVPGQSIQFSADL